MRMAKRAAPVRTAAQEPAGEHGDARWPPAAIIHPAAQELGPASWRRAEDDADEAAAT
jgi:hypothetical protein